MSSTETITAHKRTGSCLCAKVRYTLSAAPQTTVLCHCNNCCKASGSAFMTNNWYNTDEFTLEPTSQDYVRSYTDHNAVTSATVTRYFCGECGSPTHLTNSQHPESVIVTNGTIDVGGSGGENGKDGGSESMGSGTGVGGGEWRPIKEFHCDERAKWMPKVEGSEMLDSM